MQTLFCHAFGPIEDLKIEEAALPQISDKQILIEVKACGVNFPDTLMVQGKYQFKPAFPFAPGGEVAGLVRQVGAEVHGFKEGDRVFALTGYGGFAEFAAADAYKTFAIPQGMDFATAASTMYTYGTSYHALVDRAQIQAGETLLILGAASGVGLAALQIAKLLGARVIAAASSTEKLSVCAALGADFCINYENEDLKETLKQITDGNGVDIVYDAVGGHFAEPAIRSLAWRGRYLVVGFASGEIPKIPLNLALLKGAAIVGVFWGMFAQKETKRSAQNFAQILQWIQSGKLKQHIYKSYSLADSKQALLDMAQRKVIGKAIIEVGK